MHSFKVHWLAAVACVVADDYGLRRSMSAVVFGRDLTDAFIRLGYFESKWLIN